MASLPPSSQLFQASLTIHSIHLNSCVRRGTVEENSFALIHHPNDQAKSGNQTSLPGGKCINHKALRLPYI